MRNLNNYITEAWSGMKQYSLKSDIEAWCEEMGIKKYTINSQGEIDVNGHVELRYRKFEELPYKFGIVTGHFTVEGCKNLTSLKNCPDEVGGGFSCRYCKELDSLEGCPKEVGGHFWCGNCKRKFIKQTVVSFCKTVKGEIYNK